MQAYVSYHGHYDLRQMAPVTNIMRHSVFWLSDVSCETISALQTWPAYMIDSHGQWSKSEIGQRPCPWSLSTG